MLSELRDSCFSIQLAGQVFRIRFMMSERNAEHMKAVALERAMQVQQDHRIVAAHVLDDVVVHDEIVVLGRKTRGVFA
jgi:hypothetical protein